MRKAGERESSPQISTDKVDPDLAALRREMLRFRKDLPAPLLVPTKDDQVSDAQSAQQAGDGCPHAGCAADNDRRLGSSEIEMFESSRSVERHRAEEC